MISDDNWNWDNRTNKITECYNEICAYVIQLTEEKLNEFVEFLVKRIEIIVIEINDEKRNTWYSRV